MLVFITYSIYYHLCDYFIVCTILLSQLLSVHPFCKLNCVEHGSKEIIVTNYVIKLNNQASSRSSFPFPRKTNKKERITENKYQTGEFKNWLVLVCCKWEVFFLSLRQEVICSVQQAFCWEGFLRSVSHALALSRQAGSSQ